MPTNLDKVVKPSWAAKVLGIAYCDLPKLDHPWTKADVRKLREGNPDWLTEARRRHGNNQQEAAEARMTQLVAAFARLGYDAPDLATPDQAIHYLDGARTHLMTETHCWQDEADRAAWRGWPTSMAAEEADAETSYDEADW